MTGITYEEALSTLNSMFGEPWTQTHLESVLRHFEGHMENTVETILTHGDGEPDALISRLLNKGSGVADLSTDEALARQLAEEESKREEGQRKQFLRQKHGNKRSPQVSTFGGSNFTPRRPKSQQQQSSTSTPSVPTKKGIGTPTELPRDFLRVPGQKYDDQSGDEALARMLQDELFTAELANNPEFAHLARGRMPAHLMRGSNAHFPPNAASSGPGVVEQLSNLGNEAKLKLAQLAAQWNARNNNSANDINQRSGNARQEQRGLLDSQHDNDDDDFFGFAGSSNNNNNEMEMRSIGNAGGSSKKKD